MRAWTPCLPIRVYTPEEFAEMQAEGDAFAEMIAEEARLIYAGKRISVNLHSAIHKKTTELHF